MKGNYLSHHVNAIVSAIHQRLKDHQGPLIVSLDGGSGAGKSSLATEVSSSIKSTVIPCDDFFNISIPDKEWDSYSLEERCRLCIEWERIRNEVLSPLRSGEQAAYLPYYHSTTNDPATGLIIKEPSDIIILDGIYSSQWLNELVHLTVLVAASPDVRYERHNLREGTEDIEWHQRWDPVEDYYFTVLRPPHTFDLVLVNESL